MPNVSQVNTKIPKAPKGHDDHPVYIGGFIPREIKAKLEKQARDNHRTVTGEFTWIVEQYFKGKEANAAS